MDQYLSTYSKDFVWPNVKKKLPTSPRSPGSSQPGSPYPGSPHGERVCMCGTEPGGYMPAKEYGGTPGGDNYQWSRLDPMGPLLDPKLYPAKMGPFSDCEITGQDQPSTYLKKLEEKFPYLYNVIQCAPPDDTVKLVDEDRLRTTYQMDYGHMDEHPTTEYDKQLGITEPSDCSLSTPMDCRRHIRPPNYSGEGQPQYTINCFGPIPNGPGALGSSREAVHGKGYADSGSAKVGRSLAVRAMRGQGGCSGKVDDGGFGCPKDDNDKRANRIINNPIASSRAPPPWISEYREIIDQTGLDIGKDKMHQHGGRSPGRSFADRAIMHCHSRC